MDRKQSASDHSFLGQGWSFPVQFNFEEGGVEVVGGVEDIEQSLRILLNTLPGERVTNLSYGCKVKSKIYDPIDGKFTFLAEEAIKDAISFHEPRIKVDRITLDYSQKAEGIIILELNYTIRQTNSRHNLVYPFSELEGTAS